MLEPPTKIKNKKYIEEVAIDKQTDSNDCYASPQSVLSKKINAEEKIAAVDSASSFEEIISSLCSAGAELQSKIQSKIEDNDKIVPTQKKLNTSNTEFKDSNTIHDVFIDLHNDFYQQTSVLAISCMPGNVYWLDKEGKSLGCNKNVLDMMGLSNIEEFRGLTFEEMGQIGGWDEKATQSFKQDTLEVIQTGQAKFNVEEPVIFHVQRKENIYFLTNRVPLLNKNNEVIGVVGISIDITERKKMEQTLKFAKEQAEENLKIKDQFIRNMEHDIRTPFNGIWGMTGYLYEIEDDPEKKEILGDVVASAKELMDFCDHILEFAKTASGELTVLEKNFHLKQLIQGIVQMQKPAACHKNLALLVEYSDNLPDYIISDAYRIQKILINIVSNAIKFTNEGFVKITACFTVIDSINSLIILSIEDSGIGIPLEKQEFIFEKFTKLTESNKMTYPGIGLGLRIVKQFMQDLKGEIKIESHLGKGTKFSLSIPCQVQ